MSKNWTYHVNFDKGAPQEEVRRVIYWIELLIRDDGARAQMAAYAEPPASFKLRPGRRSTETPLGDLVNLATDEEIDDFGE